MLEKLDFSQEKFSKEEYKSAHDDLIERLIMLQQQARADEIGLVVLFEGWDGAGKGSRISDLMYNLDARATSVHVTEALNVEEAELFEQLDQNVTGYYPFMQEFWKALGPRGNITFFDRGWYMAATQQMLFTLFGRDFGKEKKEISKKKQKKLEALRADSLKSIGEFEKLLVDDGYIVVKFFLHISEKEQKTRLVELYDDPATRWRVGKDKLLRIGNYEQAYKLYDELLEGSDSAYAPWTLVNGEDKRRANLEICVTLVDALEQAIIKKKDQRYEAAKQATTSSTPSALIDTDPHTRSVGIDQVIRARAELEASQAALLAPRTSRFPQGKDAPNLETVNRELKLTGEDYRERLKSEQERLGRLELEMYLKRIPLVVMFEGWDAAGKGGAIKRVAQALDARAYTIFPSPAPTPLEKLHPHLWRYWTRLPKAGHVGIYDRSWYGRVLVERVEGFATVAEWSRAYDEINAFEQDLINWGALLIKFWVEVSPEKQLERFQDRENNPAKQWKITDDDWRNRDKYPQYKAAIQDMFRLTSTEIAPWILLESEDKLYARVKALQVINDMLESRLREN